jgi:hypothetical protein
MSTMLTPTSLRSYVRHAELYGGYESVWDEACRDLNPLELGHLCRAMRSMSHEYRSAGCRMVETFQLPPRDRDALVSALIRQGAKTASIVDLVGCSQGHVYKLAQLAEITESGSSEAQNFSLRPSDSTGELSVVVAHPVSVEA